VWKARLSPCRQSAFASSHVFCPFGFPNQTLKLLLLAHFCTRIITQPDGFSDARGDLDEYVINLCRALVNGSWSQASPPSVCHQAVPLITVSSSAIVLPFNNPRTTSQIRFTNLPKMLISIHAEKDGVTLRTRTHARTHTRGQKRTHPSARTATRLSPFDLT
jgi:hypothetical protein